MLCMLGSMYPVLMQKQVFVYMYVRKYVSSVNAKAGFCVC